MLSGLRYTVQTTGFISLYRGLAPTLIASFPKAGIRFGGNAYLKNLMRDEHGKLTPGRPISPIMYSEGLGVGLNGRF
jgi:solute carrier family 25 (mitochondrial citrate transporter), member 1